MALNARDLLEAGVPTYVPSLWWWETANSLLVAERRKRMSSYAIDATMEVFQNLPVITDGQSSRHSAAESFALARRFGLTTYDAAYLELALRLNAALATLDKALVRAASAVGIELII